MKFDMGRAWTEALEMIKGNGKLLAIVAGVFFFLPALALTLLMPTMMTVTPGETMTPEQVMALFTGGFVFGLFAYVIISYIGTLAVLNLLSDRARPTVGEAIKAGFLGFIPYFLAQLLLGIAFAVIFIVLALIGGLAASGVLTGLLVVIALPFVAWIYTKMSLVAPVIAIDEIRNPIAALTRSWKLVSGNSLRVFLFYLVLLVTFLVVYLVLTMVLGLFAALLGPEIGLIVSAILQGILGLVFTVLFLAILAAVHRQLSGPSVSAVTETFE